MEDKLRRDRKYTAFWAVFLMSSVMAFTHVISGAEWVTVTGIVYGAYMAGNVGEHYVTSNPGTSNL